MDDLPDVRSFSIETRACHCLSLRPVIPMRSAAVMSEFVTVAEAEQTRL